MIKAKDIYEYIDGFAPFETAMSFDNAGLLIGDPDKTSEKVIVALDVTSDVIEEAVQKNASVIVTHHPVIFHPLKHVSSDSLTYKLIQNNIAVISAHTNLDICVGGVNDTLAAAIGLTITEHTNEDCFLTAELDKEISFTAFAENIKTKLRCKGLRFTSRNGNIKKVSVACGAGGGSVYSAVKAKADALITGEIKHHEILFARENNLAVYDLGHFRSEDLMMEKLTKMLTQRFPDTLFEKASNDKEDIFYLS